MSEQSRAEQFLSKAGWTLRPSGVDHMAVETCPLCSNTDYKFYMHIGGEKDGMWDCKACKEAGNLWMLRERLGATLNGVSSMKDAANSRRAPEALPDFDKLHQTLQSDAMSHVMDYLLAVRCYSPEIIEWAKLGAWRKNDMDWYVIPYFDAAGKAMYYKARSVPPADKKFDSPAGHEAPLYNATVLTAGMDEVVFVEGEGDVLALLSAGYETVVGVPGASVKKASWIELLDRLKPKCIYLLYDTDKTGQTNAKEMAARIGLDLCRNIVLPEFTREDGKPGKDINEWLALGHTLEEFEELKANAVRFDVDGVQNIPQLLDELREDIEGKGLAPTFDTCWPSLNRRIGGFEPGDLVGWIAEGKVGKTTTVLNLFHYNAITRGETSFLYCNEMLPRRMVRKWVSRATLTDDTPNSSKITLATLDESMEIARGMKGDLLFGYTRSNEYKDVLNTIRQAVRRYGVKHVCFDNLQLLITSVEHQAQQTSKICKAFKALGMELGVVMHLIIQPHRVQEGSIVAARNAMGSSSVEKDVDFMICLHRARVATIRERDFHGFLETEENFEPQMLVRVDLSRYSSGGTCTLFMDGARSYVRELGEGDITEPSKTEGGGIPVAEGEVQSV